MKKLLTSIAVFLVITLSSAQETYLVFEFMKVKSGNIGAYWDTENFWEKIHAERVKSGEIVAWDLWSLEPGGYDQGYQYLTVTVYNDPLKMLDGGDVFAAAHKAYPKMSDEDILEAFNKGGKSRELGQRLYLQVVNTTKDEFKMEVGTVNRINFMSAAQGKEWAYEKSETEVFKPIHQKNVDAGRLAHWGMARVNFPSGSKVKTTHITFDMFTGNKQMMDYFTPNDDFKPDEASMKKMQQAVKARDLTWTYMATLVKKVK